MKKNLSSYSRLIARFPNMKILVVGDLMVDCFIRGKVSRISPEAPVPVVKVKEEVNLPGGSGNVIMNLNSLGCKVLACGVVGEDSIGDRLLEKFQKARIQTKYIVKDSSRPTILKTRVIAEHQQVVRFDTETDHPLSFLSQKKLLDSIREMTSEIDGVILSDYGKGVITKPLLKETIALANRFKKPICVDPKLEHFLSYQKITCITPNLTEALGGMHKTRADSQKEVERLGKQILQRLRSKSVLITQGEAGMTLFEKKSVTHIPAKAREVYDVTGAGDTVISVLTLSLACGATLLEASTLANLAAGIVVGKLGTATVTPQELTDALKQLQ